jgi:UPF0755 protein
MDLLKLSNNIVSSGTGNGDGLKPVLSSQPKRRHIFRWIAGIICVLLLCAAGISAYFWREINTPVSWDPPKEKQPFTITKGEGVKEIATHLEQVGLIRHAGIFEWYVYLKKQGTRLQAGDYALQKYMNIRGITSMLVAGEALPKDISITFPEGFTSRDIDAALTENGILKAGQFIRAAQDHEGYLFPDTYRFAPGASASSIRTTMLANFDKKFALVRRPEESWGRSQNDIVIMASIIEKEVRTPDDMRIVSGILWKRIAIGMPMQADATVVYFTGKKNGEITIYDLAKPSPYNTYLNLGLPPGPICNPGLNALEAAAKPQESDYLYYLSKPTGETVFSRTLEEHNTAKAKFLP